MAAPDHERREPRRVRGAARAEGLLGTSTRTPAGAPSTTTTWSAQAAFMETSSSRSSCGVPATAKGERLGLDLYVPRTRSARCAGQCSSGSSSTGSQKIDGRRCCALSAGDEGRGSRAYELVYAALGREAPARLHRSRPRGRAWRARSTAGCSGSRRDVLEARPVGFLWYRVGDLELHLMLLDEPRPTLCLAVDDLARLAAPGGGRRDARRHQLVGRPRFTCATRSRTRQAPVVRPGNDRILLAGSTSARPASGRRDRPRQLLASASAL